jgi:hypothetical protein
VVSVSSFGHRLASRFEADDLFFEHRGYGRWPAYFQSKLANLLFTRGLASRLTTAGSSTLAVAAHPGAARTDLGIEGSGLSNKLIKPFYPYTTQSAAKGAEPIVRAGVDPTAKNGAFYGPRFLFFGSAVSDRRDKRAATKTQRPCGRPRRTSPAPPTRRSAEASVRLDLAGGQGHQDADDGEEDELLHGVSDQTVSRSRAPVSDDG